ncbi:DUF4419 domain-containing protein [Pseudomonas serbica]|uniref:DUF4419 domain-containing protein n=1 Tax=Pseudomonas serbica TaxID=2965074 RepID=UPI00237AB66D|nr:DUF4419 domain-containing protein [Pseudomonas serbica]
MIITLNDELKYVPPTEQQAANWNDKRQNSHKGFADRFANKWHLKAYSDVDGVVVRGLRDHQRTQTGFINVVAQAYSRHIGLVVNPHDIWFVILSNVVALIQEHADEFRSIFTVSDKKESLLVLQDHPTDINIDKLIKVLKAAAPVDLSMFLPEFSDTTPEAQLAMAASVLDMAQHHYDYCMFCCGIPAIDLRGTREDWLAICDAITDIKKAVYASGASPDAIISVTPYLGDALNIASNILESFDQDQTEFWTDIFTQKNVGSGGDLQINGWICDLYHNVKRGSLLASFHDSVSKFPYKNVSTGQNFLMVHGAFGSNIENGFVTTVYDHITIEYTPK